MQSEQNRFAQPKHVSIFMSLQLTKPHAEHFPKHPILHDEQYFLPQTFAGGVDGAVEYVLVLINSVCVE